MKHDGLVKAGTRDFPLLAATHSPCAVQGTRQGGVEQCGKRKLGYEMSHLPKATSSRSTFHLAASCCGGTPKLSYYSTAFVFFI